MKEKIYKYSFITFVIINLITLYLFYDYFTEKPMLFSGLGIIINFCRLLAFGTGLGFILINEIPTKGADNKLVVFLHPKNTNGVLIELCQEIK